MRRHEQDGTKVNFGVECENQIVRDGDRGKTVSVMQNVVVQVKKSLVSVFAGLI